jgi:hypothetical protein
MSVQTTHPLYDEFLEVWEKCSDAFDGQKAIKAKGETYLPRLSGQMPTPQDISQKKSYGWMAADEEYALYLQRAVYYNYIKKITNGLSEQLFRRDVKIDVPPKMQDVLDYFTHDGKSIRTAIKESNKRILLRYRDLLVIDVPVVEEGSVRSLEDEEKQHIRPYVTYYPAEQVINWEFKIKNNRNVLVRVVIKEIEYEEGEDEFTKEEIDQYRVLDLDNDTESENLGYYRVRVFREQAEGKWEAHETIYPVVNNEKLTYIPAYFLTQKGISGDIDYPMLNDAVDLNIAHYINSADYENAINITGSPTPVIIGYHDDPDMEDNEIALGSRALLLSGQGAQAYYMEYRGEGPGAIAKAMEKKVDALSVLASKMLQQDPKGVESAETAEIHRSAEQGMLASMALSLSEAYEVILYTIAEWMGIEGEITILFNTDYSVKIIDPNLFGNLNNARQAGLISQYLYFYNLLKGEMIPEDWTMEDEAEARAADVVSQAFLTYGYTDEDDDDDQNDDDDEGDED